MRLTQQKLMVELPVDFRKIRFPRSFDRRLQALLERQNALGKLTLSERKEAEELARLAEQLTLLRMRTERAAAKGRKGK